MLISSLRYTELISYGLSHTLGHYLKLENTIRHVKAPVQ